MEVLSRNDYCRGKAVSSTYSECVCVCVCRRMRPIILSSVACLALPYTYTLSYKRQGIQENVFEHKIRV